MQLQAFAMLNHLTPQVSNAIGSGHPTNVSRARRVQGVVHLAAGLGRAAPTKCSGRSESKWADKEKPPWETQRG